MKLRLNIQTIAIMVAFATMMGSCNIYKSYEAPKEGLAASVAQTKSEPVDSTALGNLAWQDVFKDATLQSLINQALENNSEMKNAKLNIDIAQANLLGAKLSYLPSLSFNPNGAGAKYGSGTSMTWTYQLPMSASWEIDVFAKLTNAKRQAKASLIQSEAYRQAVKSQLIAAVVNNYYTIVTLKRQLVLYKETAEHWKQSVETMKHLKEAGRYTEVAVVQSEANYNSVLASIPEVELALHQAYNSMSILLDVTPQAWTVNEEAAPVIVHSAIANGIPMSAVAWRPDVAAGEQSLAIAYYNTNLARASFYPSLVISANGGFTNAVGSMISNPGKWFIQLAGQLSAPIFSRGRNIQNLKVAKATQEQAMNNFEHTVLNACGEVSNSLVKLNKKVEEQKYIKVQVESLSKAVAYNEDLQTLGTATYLEVLNAQQSLLASQIQMLQNELTISQASVSLYQALGGGR